MTKELTEFTKYRLADVATIEVSTVDKKTKEGENPVRLCNFVDVYKQWAITTNHYNSFMEASANQRQLEKFLLKKGQVAITKDSETRYDIGISTYIADDFQDVVLGYHCALITPQKDVLDGGYLNAFMHSSYIQQYFENNATGSGMRYTLSLDTIGNIPILAPSIDKQKEIAKIFADIERKIALNKSINHNLEAMAKELYDYWFVQFDFPNAEGKPYKSSGGKMVWNEKLKREVPEGWEVDAISSWLEIKSGFPFKSETYNTEGKYKIITIKNVQDHYLDTKSCDYIDIIPVGIKEWCKLKQGDRLISLTGNCGRVCVVTEDNLLLNQRVGVLDCDNNFIEYAYLMLSSEEFQAKCQNLAKGAAQANLSPIDLCKIEFYHPNNEILDKFTKIIDVLTSSFIKNNVQITALTRQRDELLPLLMNGQVVVKE